MGKQRRKEQRRLERLRSEDVFAAALKKSQKSRQGILRLLESIESREIQSPGEVQGDWCKLLVKGYHRICFRPKYRRAAAMFKQLLLLLEKKRCRKVIEDADAIRALFYLAMAHDQHIRDINQWQKQGRGKSKIVKSMIDFCLVRYKVPAFFYQCWFEEYGGRERYWFYLLANGTSVRSLPKLPLVVTKKIAHYFLQAPAAYSVNQALRWAQAMGQGANLRTAQAIIASRLGRNNFVDEEFWQKVVLLFCQNRFLEQKQLAEVVDYLAWCRGQSLTYSVKGRSLTGLLRQSAAWHRQVAEQKRAGNLVWNRNSIGEYEFIKKEKELQIVYRIFELNTSQQLYAEGRAMNNCVASYARHCHLGGTAIFVLRGTCKGVEQHLVTIEVNLRSREVVQALARFNKKPAGLYQQVIADWARREKLAIAGYAFS